MVRVLDLGSNSFIVLVLQNEEILLEKVYELGLKALMKNKEVAFNTAKQILSKALSESDFSCLTYAFGTSVFRDHPEFFEALTREFRLNGYILSEEEEAMYSYMSVDPGLSKNITVVDLGGGSLEIVRKDCFKSYCLGTHVLNDLFDLTLPNAVDFEKAVKYIKNQIFLIFPELGETFTIGGSFVAIAALKKGLWDLKTLHGEKLTREDILKVLNEVRFRNFEWIKAKGIIPQGREKTLMAGLAVALAITQLSEDVKVSTKGYRHTVGLMLEKSGKLLHPWRARGDLNSRPPDPQSGALSS